MAYLRQLPNVAMTPQIAFYTAEAVESVVDAVLGAFTRY